MTRVDSVLSVLHQIDTLRGKICETCNHRRRKHKFLHQIDDPVECGLGYKPAGASDGCDDWQAVSRITARK